uniref:Prohead serine protease domain-containing protein n=1 Tax=uncultured organism TaxID=155900 RepID=A0A7L9QC27_9ZZZZ|nr:hypothetical protein [uncultured organism]
MSHDIERRYLTQPVEFRATGSDASPGNLVGYAAVFESRSQNLGGFVEVVDRAAFNKSIADNVRVLCRFNHKDDGLLGTTDAGTVTLVVDNIGLRYDCVLPNTSVGRDVAVLAARGDLRNSSFAFECMDEQWGVTERGFPERRVLAARLVDVAPVVNPAYLDATTALRSLADHLGITVEVVTEKSTEELRALLTGAPADNAELTGELGEVPPSLADEEDPEDEAMHNEAVYLEQNSITGDAQRETHAVPVNIRLKLRELAAKH